MTSFLNASLESYIGQAQSSAPTPGGGSVSALVGALGSCMASMAANFTVGKKKFVAVEAEVQSILDALSPLRAEMLSCMDEDAIVFAAIGAAYGLPKETDIEKSRRKEAIQTALADAMEVPLRVMRAGVAAQKLLPRLAEIGNPNLVSDTGVATILIDAAVRAAHLNVLINLTSLTDAQRADDASAEVADLLVHSTSLAQQTQTIVENTILR